MNEINITDNLAQHFVEQGSSKQEGYFVARVLIDDNETENEGQDDRTIQ